MFDDIRAQISAASLRNPETPLSRELAESYRLITEPAVKFIIDHYVQAVLAGLIRWTNIASGFETSADIEPGIGRLFAENLVQWLPRQMERHLKASGRAAAKALKQHIPLEKENTLDMAPFQLEWARQLGKEAALQAARLVHEYNFHELLYDFPLAPEPYHSQVRNQQLDSWLNGILTVLDQDKKEMSLRLTAFLQDEPMLERYCRRILDSLNDPGE